MEFSRAVPINEVFYGLQGEGTYVGEPTAFIRLQGCNLEPGCTWCDTRYASKSGGDNYAPDYILQQIEQYNCRWVCITGGEPLMHLGLVHLVEALRQASYSIEVETNGTYRPPDWYNKVNSWVVDIKCPSSGVNGQSRWDVWSKLRRPFGHDQLKFVVSTEEDLSYVKRTLEDCTPVPEVFVSPVIRECYWRDDNQLCLPVVEFWDVPWAQRVVEFCKTQGLRMSLQQHKLLYGVHKRGV